MIEKGMKTWDCPRVFRCTMRVEPKPIELTPETRALLQELGRGQELFAPYGLDPDEAATELASITEPMLEDAALPIVTIQQLRWYVRDLARVFRVLNGFALAFRLGLLMRKWARFGLEPDLMGMVLAVVVNQLRLLAGPEETCPNPDWPLLVPVQMVEAREPILPPIRAGPSLPQPQPACLGAGSLTQRETCSFRTSRASGVASRQK